jgi:hypothetical protein
MQPLVACGVASHVFQSNFTVDCDKEKKGRTKNNILKAMNLYELFFASIPPIIEKEVTKHWDLIFTFFSRKTN